MVRNSNGGTDNPNENSKVTLEVGGMFGKRISQVNIHGNRTVNPMDDFAYNWSRYIFFPARPPDILINAGVTVAGTAFVVTFLATFTMVELIVPATLIGMLGLTSWFAVKINRSLLVPSIARTILTIGGITLGIIGTTQYGSGTQGKVANTATNGNQAVVSHKAKGNSSGVNPNGRTVAANRSRAATVHGASKGVASKTVVIAKCRGSRCVGNDGTTYIFRKRVHPQ